MNADLLPNVGVARPPGAGVRAECSRQDLNPEQSFRKAPFYPVKLRERCGL
jgi:hypothetical protein